MDLSRSYETFIPEDVRSRYEFAETRDAAGFLSAAHPEAWNDILGVLGDSPPRPGRTATFAFTLPRVLR